ncbi:MAG: hypothetical protein A2Y38_01420 [Spirochaetes bacterium GWB1_59_5]|nr:MAG: hypothetical protein A2Y38_01420 [Spirochaetes bacterium GWB1_59_5]
MTVGNPAPGFPGVRTTPGFEPAPNAEPLGALTGAPPRTKFYSRPVIPAVAVGVGGNEATQIVDGTAANRVAVLLAPDVGFTIFIGPSGVSPATGLALPPGQPYEAILVGLQDLYAVSNAPVWLPLQVQVAPVLMAERERKL